MRCEGLDRTRNPLVRELVAETAAPLVQSLTSIRQLFGANGGADEDRVDGTDMLERAISVGRQMVVLGRK